MLKIKAAQYRLQAAQLRRDTRTHADKDLQTAQRELADLYDQRSDELLAKAARADALAVSHWWVHLAGGGCMGPFATRTAAVLASVTLPGSSVSHQSPRP